MKKLLSLALVAATAATPALAQDARAPFTGLRLEGLVGGDRVQGGGHDNGFLYGVGAGYDMQFGKAVGGVEVEASDSTVKECGFGICVKASRDLYAGGRIGAVVGTRALVYLKAGYTNARFTTNGFGSTNLDGVRVGGGAEFSLSANTFLKAEYRYSNYEAGASRHQIVGGFGVRF